MPDSLSDTAIVYTNVSRLADGRRSKGEHTLVLARPEYFHEWMFVRLAFAKNSSSLRVQSRSKEIRTGSLEKMGPSATFFTTKELLFYPRVPSSVHKPYHGQNVGQLTRRRSHSRSLDILAVLLGCGV